MYYVFLLAHITLSTYPTTYKKYQFMSNNQCTLRNPSTYTGQSNITTINTLTIMMIIMTTMITITAIGIDKTNNKNVTYK